MAQRNLAVFERNPALGFPGLFLPLRRWDCAKFAKFAKFARLGLESVWKHKDLGRFVLFLGSRAKYAKFA